MTPKRSINGPGLVAACMALCGCTPPGGIRITPVPPDQTLHEEVVSRDKGWYGEKIAIVDVDGVITNSQQNGFFSEGEHPVSLLVEKLRAAASDDNVKAVILRINSPGGTVTASHLMHHEITKFKRKTGKPVIAIMMDVAASGGYFIACAADEILAHQTTVTGSIGVIMQMVDVSGTLAKIGVETDAIVSGPRKDSGSPFRHMRPEERETFQSVVDAMYDQFVQVVKSGRPSLSESRIRELADGRIYLAPDALENGLIDAIGTLDDAIASAKKRADLDRAKMVLYHRPLGWRPTWYAESPARPAGTTVNLLNISLHRPFASEPTFLYLWTSGVSGS